MTNLRASWYIAAFFVVVMLLTLIGSCEPARAEISDEMKSKIMLHDAWKFQDDTPFIHAILGEARGEGYRGMYAVACAIRNRGTLKGIYGATANISDVIPEIRQLASHAWYESEGEHEDVTNGGNSWENISKFGTPFWAKGKRPTAIIGQHRFFFLKEYSRK